MSQEPFLTENHFGQRVHLARKTRNWSLSEMAERSGIGRNTLWSIEQKPTCRLHDKTLQKLCKVLDISPQEIMLANMTPESKASIDTIFVVNVTKRGKVLPYNKINIFTNTEAQATFRGQYAVGENAFAVVAYDDVLAPNVQKGDTLVFVQESTRNKSPEGVFLIRTNGDYILGFLGQTKNTNTWILRRGDELTTIKKSEISEIYQAVELRRPL